jgi:hypothetical protein
VTAEDQALLEAKALELARPRMTKALDAARAELPEGAHVAVACVVPVPGTNGHVMLVGSTDRYFVAPMLRTWAERTMKEPPHEREGRAG